MYIHIQWDVFIYFGFYVTFNTVQVISRRVVGRAEETSTYSWSRFCAVNCRPTASNYHLSLLRLGREPKSDFKGGMQECSPVFHLGPTMGCKRSFNSEQACTLIWPLLHRICSWDKITQLYFYRRVYKIGPNTQKIGHHALSCTTLATENGERNTFFKIRLIFLTSIHLPKGKDSTLENIIWAVKR